MKNSYIYKYCSFDVGEIIVSSQLLKFSNPNSFNDPFDCDIDLLIFDFSDCCQEINDDITKAKSILIAKHGDAIKKQIEDIPINKLEEYYKRSQLDKISRSSVCCFSKEYKNTSLWAHYADNHKGICLIFDLLEEHPFIEYDSYRFAQGPVDYENYNPVNYLKSKMEGISRLFFTKSKDWKYESEYRFQILEESGFFKFNKNFLKGVIFGLRVPDEKISKFKSICNKLGFKNMYYSRFIKENLHLQLVNI